MDGRLWLKKITLNDTLGVYKNDLIVDIIGHTTDKKRALCVARPRDILKPLSQLIQEVDLTDLIVANIRTDYFTLILSEQFSFLLKFKSFKLLINKDERKIIAVYTMDATNWRCYQCSISIPVPENSIQI